jgi:SAM-dependent methyltransferase
MPEMTRKILFSCLLACLCLSCERIETPADIKAKFLAKTDLQTPNAVIQKQMDSLKVSLSDIYNYCLKSKDFAYKSKFITCIYGKVENYLQEDNPEYSKAVLYDLNKFSDVMRSFKTPEHKTFLDVGSGNGEKVYAALCWGFEKSYGLEYSQKLVQISQHALQEFIQQKKIDIVLADALKTSPDIYKDKDVIYLFAPIKDNRLMAQLAEKILQNMKNGAVLLEMSFDYSKELRKRTKLAFPDMPDIAIKKENDKFYYTSPQSTEKDWKELVK